EPAHARVPQTARAPPTPAEHARLACCARVRGLPPPGASRSSRYARSLLPAPPPAKAYSALHSFSHAHGLPPPGDGAVRPGGSRDTALSAFHSSWLPNRPLTRGGGRGSERAAKRSSERRRGAAGPLTCAQHARRS